MVTAPRTRTARRAKRDARQTAAAIPSVLPMVRDPGETEIPEAICPICRRSMIPQRRILSEGGVENTTVSSSPYWEMEGDSTRHFAIILGSRGRGTLRLLRYADRVEVPELFESVKAHMVQAIREWLARGWLLPAEMQSLLLVQQGQPPMLPEPLAQDIQDIVVVPVEGIEPPEPKPRRRKPVRVSVEGIAPPPPETRPMRRKPGRVPIRDLLMSQARALLSRIQPLIDSPSDDGIATLCLDMLHLFDAGLNAIESTSHKARTTSEERERINRFVDILEKASTHCEEARNAFTSNNLDEYGRAMEDLRAVLQEV